MAWEQFDSNGNLKTSVNPLRYSTRTLSAAATVNVGDYIIFLNTSVGPAFTVTLPTAVGNTGAQFVFIDISGNAHNFNVTIDGNGAETINGAATYVMNLPREALTMISNGTAWFTY
jgi:hypothetical protein